VQLAGAARSPAAQGRTGEQATPGKTGEQAAQEDEIVAMICYELGVTIREPARRKTGRVGGARRGVGSGELGRVWNSLFHTQIIQ